MKANEILLVPPPDLHIFMEEMESGGKSMPPASEFDQASEISLPNCPVLVQVQETQTRHFSIGCSILKKIWTQLSKIPILCIYKKKRTDYWRMKGNKELKDEWNRLKECVTRAAEIELKTRREKAKRSDMTKNASKW